MKPVVRVESLDTAADASRVADDRRLGDGDRAFDASPLLRPSPLFAIVELVIEPLSETPVPPLPEIVDSSMSKLAKYPARTPEPRFPEIVDSSISTWDL